MPPKQPGNKLRAKERKEPEIYRNDAYDRKAEIENGGA